MALPSSAQSTQEATSVPGSLATFGGGCFWCMEAIFESLDGIPSVQSGYMGGYVENPSYKAVCSGETGHAEVVQIEYDPKAVSYSELLDLFWKAHDPTQLNRQGADVGTQYRSVIFYHNLNQRTLAEASKKELAASNIYSRPIVTEITQAAVFYPAEDYHQDYYRNHGNAPYCAIAIRPKLKKLGLEKSDEEAN